MIHGEERENQLKEIENLPLPQEAKDKLKEYSGGGPESVEYQRQKKQTPFISKEEQDRIRAIKEMREGAKMAPPIQQQMPTPKQIIDAFNFISAKLSIRGFQVANFYEGFPDSGQTEDCLKILYSYIQPLANQIPQN